MNRYETPSGETVTTYPVGINFGWVAIARTASGQLIGETECYGTERNAYKFAVDMIDLATTEATR